MLVWTSLPDDALPRPTHRVPTRGECVLIAALAFMGELAMNLADVAFPRWIVPIGLVDALLVASLVFVLLWQSRERRLRMQHSLRVIADCNHHVRNALQAIVGQAGIDASGALGVHDAVERIRWVLEEVLPQVSGKEPK
jgi:hypothetical protein